MRRPLAKPIGFIIFLVIPMIVFANMAHADPLVTMTSSSAHCYVGQELKLKILITDEDTINRVGWDGRILYDPDYFSFQDISAKDLNPVESAFAFNTPDPGRIIVINYNMQLNTMSGQGVIAEAVFIPRRVGYSVIELQNFTFSDSTASRIPVILDPGLALSIEEQNPADMDGDNDIDGTDLSLFAKAYEEGNPPVHLDFFADNFPQQAE